MRRHSIGLLIRWSWRDLRRRWLLVTAIALVIALGTGIFAALQSMTAWRRASNDASFAALAMHDVEVELGTGQFLDQGTILDAIEQSPHAGAVERAQERLLVATPVDASTSSETILVSGQLVGLPTPTEIDRVHVVDGAPSTDGAWLEVNFARFYDLPSSGTVRVRGEQPLDYVGTATAPEYFYITGPDAGLFAHAQYAVLFAPLDVAQQLTGHVGQVNDLVLTLQPGSDPEAIADDLEDTLSTSLPVTVSVTTRADDPVYTTLYEDIDNDQQVMTIMAVLVLAGAAFAAFNLISRIVEAERREIGIGMALGAPPWRVGVRPLLVGLQVALLGAAAGVGLGYLGADALAGVMEEFVPLPIWETTLDPGVFVQAALVGLLLPTVATIIPVWRAVRVEPVEAIRTGHLAARQTTISRLGRRIRMPGVRSYTEMPLRNILRTPRRTVLTALGIGAAITSLVAILGMLDTFLGTIDANTAELQRTAEDRMIASLDTFQPVDSPVVSGIVGDPTVGRAEPGLVLGGVVRGGEGFELMIELLDTDEGIWTPSLQETATVDGPSVVLSRKAAEDLAVVAGETIGLTHLVLDPASGAITTATTEVSVAGIHPGAFRFQAYMDLDDADLFGAEGLANRVTLLPADGVEPGEVQRSLFQQAGIGGVQAVGQAAEVFEDFLGQFVGIFQVVQFVVLLLALLIAFNSSSITVDERGREHATMFAFGLPLRQVVSMITIESLITGVLGTLVGMAAGYGLLVWAVTALFPTVLPDVGLVTAVSPASLGIAALLGIVAVAVAPLLTVRKLRRMDIPSTLRVVE